MLKRLGLFGGTFDPPHRGHIAMAESFLTQLELTSLLVIPAGHSYHKSTTETPAHARYAMCRLAFADEPKIEVSRVDLNRPGNTYTFDTLTLIKKHYPDYEFWWLMGSDAFLAIASWHEVSRLPALTSLAIALRNQDKEQDILRQNQSLASPFQLKILSLKPYPIDSTAARAGVAGASEEKLRQWLTPPVIAYIHTHHLYGS